MSTHHFVTDDDINNGYFSDDNGKRLYSYIYDPDSKTLSVKCGAFGHEKDLSGFGIKQLSDKELSDRLIGLAEEIGEDLRANPPIQG